MILVGVILIAVLSSALTYATIRNVNQRSLQSRLQILSERSNLATLIQMVYSTPAACAANLTVSGFGTTYAEFVTRSQSHHLAFLNPGSTGVPGSAGSIMLAGGSLYDNRIPVTGIDFTPGMVNAKLNPGAAPNVYLAYLNVHFAGNLKPATVAFYLVAKGGLLVGCSATSTMPASENAYFPFPMKAEIEYPAVYPKIITIEDNICIQFGKSNYLFFDPSINTCRYM